MYSSICGSTRLPSASMSATWPPTIPFTVPAEVATSVRMATRRSRYGCSADGLKRQRQKRIARENSDGFAELLVARRLAAAKVVIIEGWQVVMNQRIGVDEFDGAGRIVRRRDVAVENARRLKAKNGTDSLAACKDAIPHRRVNGRRGHGVCGQQPLESGVHGKAVFLEKGRKFHCGGKLAHGRQRGRFTIHPHVQDQTVRRQACRRLF